MLPDFSHGQKKKFFIAFALACGAKLILLDEPTNGLDIPSKAQFRKLIAAHADAGKTFVISTHQVHDVEHLVDAIVMMDAGKILLNASVEKITQTLQSTLQSVVPEPSTCLYYEKSLAGYHVMKAASDGKETAIDFEFLFNAVLTARENITTLFLGDKNEKQ
jgi:ABC-2 type transport system ATP-binding protein